MLLKYVIASVVYGAKQSPRWTVDCFEAGENVPLRILTCPPAPRKDIEEGVYPTVFLHAIALA